MKKFRVIGEAPFKGYAPGEVFEAEFTDEDEARFIERGAIELADEATEVKAESDEGDQESGATTDEPVTEDDTPAEDAEQSSGLFGGGRKERS